MINATTRMLYTGKKARYPFYRRLGGRPDRPKRRRNILPSAALVTRPVQHVATTNTDFAHLVHFIYIYSVCVCVCVCVCVYKIHNVNIISDFWII